MNTNQPKKPERVFRMKNLKIALWPQKRKEGEDDGGSYSAVIGKRYRDADGQWHDTQTLFASDLLRLAALAQRAAVWMEMKEEEGEKA